MPHPMKQTVSGSKSDTPPITADPRILGGEPVFAGTRVPVKSLFEHLEANCTIEEFLAWFPTVSREAATEVLLESHRLAVEKAQH